MHNILSTTCVQQQALRTVDNSGSCSVLTPKRGSFSPFLLKLDFSFLGLDLTPEMTDMGEMSFDGDCMDTCLVVVAEKKAKINTIRNCRLIIIDNNCLNRLASITLKFTLHVDYYSFFAELKLFTGNEI